MEEPNQNKEKLYFVVETKGTTSEEGRRDLENLKINCIPESLYLMNVDDYDSFLKQRRILMAKKIKDYYNTL